MRRITTTLALLRAVCLALALGTPAASEPIAVVTTLPDLADLVTLIGGDEVRVRALVRGPQDPHFIEPRPSFVKDLHRAELFVEAGLQLEIGWSPVLLRSSRNPKIRPGGEGYLDASTVIVPLDVPGASYDRSAGDVHPYGNPHYLSDPLNGWRVAARIRDVLAGMRPASADDFEARFQAFEARLLAALVGERLAEAHPPRALAQAISDGSLEALRGALPLEGWLGLLAPHAGALVVQDHRIFPYFARRFGLVPVVALEPRPGIAPTTAHLAKVVDTMRSRDIQLILASPFFDERHARRVAEETGARVVTLAHQVGALPGADDYLATIDLNVRAVAAGISAP